MFRFLTTTHNVQKAIHSTKPTHFLQTLTSISTPPTSFTVSYLINSCGLSHDKALSASNKIQLKTPQTPDSILALFRAHGFSNAHISTIIQKRPNFLLSTQTNLKPKLAFFRSVGLSGPDLAKIIATVPYILLSSLDHHIVPTVEFLKTIVGDNASVVRVLKRSTRLIMENPSRDLLPKVDLLRSHGVPDCHIASLLTTQPRSFLVKFDRLREVAEKVKKMEFDPSRFGFVRAISALIGLGKSGFEMKVGVYRRWGWSDDEIHEAFRRDPFCMMLSEKKIMCNMGFFVDEMGYDPRQIAKYPVVLMYSMEKRIFPRWKVMQLLASKGLIANDIALSTLLNLTNQEFLRKYVTKFEDLVPELLSLHQRTMDGLESAC